MILNIDAGELDTEPEELIAAAHRVHVACGGHAGDEVSMAKTVALAKANGVEVGAHPSYQDRQGFGRRSLSVGPDQLRAQIAAQCASLKAIADAQGLPILSAKPHGALYHDTLSSPDLAAALLDAVTSALGAVQIVTQPGALATLARERGLEVLREGFADRGMFPDGRLIPRGQPNAMIEDPALAVRQARALLASGTIDTLCVHGDGPNALAIALAVRKELGA